MMMSVTMHPIWQSGAVILGIGVVASMLLQLLVHRLLPEAVRRDHTELGAAIFAVIGTTYAVLLAFMAMTAWDRYSAAESLTRQEANLAARIIGVAESLPGPAGSAIRAGTLAYLTHIVGAEWPDQVAGRTLPAADTALPGLRRSVTGFVPGNESQARLQDLLIGAVGDLESARRDRRLAAEGTIPHLVWAVLLSGGALLVGFSFLVPGVVPAGLRGRVFTVGKLSLGYIHDLHLARHVRLGLGGLVSRYAFPAALDHAYGNPTSYMVFLRVKLGG